MNDVFVSFCRNVILPTGIAIALSTWLKKEEKGWISHFSRRFFQLLGVDTISLTSNSWDYLFFTLQKAGGSYVILELRDGSYVYGLWGTKSFASSGRRGGENDIFLEETYANSEFIDSNGSGCLIHQSDIRTIDVAS